jgi:protein-S-isoprenylcysteine O-methyltransferase Ste14
MLFGAWHCIEWVWSLVGIYWLLGALRSKRAVRRQTRLSRVIHLTIMATALFLLFNGWARIGVLGARLFPERNWIAWVGFAITVAGCTFAVWARVLLGTNWSATITVKQNHELVRNGPYAVVRHPVYAGFLLAILGTALTLGEVRVVVAFALAFVGWFTKARTEEQFLVEQFGDVYAHYRREVSQLIPFIL